tara:strand:- start:2804 stop:6007 length:3204 start_codon:yes stop_codon:yes gene_type:complete
MPTDYAVADWQETAAPEATMGSQFGGMNVPQGETSEYDPGEVYAYVNLLNDAYLDAVHDWIEYRKGEETIMVDGMPQGGRAPSAPDLLPSNQWLTTHLDEFLAPTGFNEESLRALVADMGVPIERPEVRMNSLKQLADFWLPISYEEDPLAPGVQGDVSFNQGEAWVDAALTLFLPVVGRGAKGAWKATSGARSNLVEKMWTVTDEIPWAPVSGMRWNGEWRTDVVRRWWGQLDDAERLHHREVFAAERKLDNVPLAEQLDDRDLLFIFNGSHSYDEWAGMAEMMGVSEGPQTAIGRFLYGLKGASLQRRITARAGIDFEIPAELRPGGATVSSGLDRHGRARLTPGRRLEPWEDHPPSPRSPFPTQTGDTTSGRTIDGVFYARKRRPQTYEHHQVDLGDRQRVVPGLIDWGDEIRGVRPGIIVRDLDVEEWTDEELLAFTQGRFGFQNETDIDHIWDLRQRAGVNPQAEGPMGRWEIEYRSAYPDKEGRADEAWIMLIDEEVAIELGERGYTFNRGAYYGRLNPAPGGVLESGVIVPETVRDEGGRTIVGHSGLVRDIYDLPEGWEQTIRAYSEPFTGTAPRRTLTVRDYITDNENLRRFYILKSAEDNMGTRMTAEVAGEGHLGRPWQQITGPPGMSDQLRGSLSTMTDKQILSAYRAAYALGDGMPEEIADYLWRFRRIHVAEHEGIPGIMALKAGPDFPSDQWGNLRPHPVGWPAHHRGREMIWPTVNIPEAAVLHPHLQAPVNDFLHLRDRLRQIHEEILALNQRSVYEAGQMVEAGGIYANEVAELINEADILSQQMRTLDETFFAGEIDRVSGAGIPDHYTGNLGEGQWLQPGFSDLPVRAAESPFDPDQISISKRLQQFLKGHSPNHMDFLLGVTGLTTASIVNPYHSEDAMVYDPNASTRTEYTDTPYTGDPWGLELNGGFGENVERFITDSEGRVMPLAGRMEPEYYRRLYDDLALTDPDGARELGTIQDNPFTKGSAAMLTYANPDGEKWAQDNAGGYGLSLRDGWSNIVEPVGVRKQNQSTDYRGMEQQQVMDNLLELAEGSLRYGKAGRSRVGR